MKFGQVIKYNKNEVENKAEIKLKMRQEEQFSISGKASDLQLSFSVLR